MSFPRSRIFRKKFILRIVVKFLLFILEKMILKTFYKQDDFSKENFSYLYLNIEDIKNSVLFTPKNGTNYITFIIKIIKDNSLEKHSCSKFNYKKLIKVLRTILIVFIAVNFINSYLAFAVEESGNTDFDFENAKRGKLFEIIKKLILLNSKEAIALYAIVAGVYKICIQTIWNYPYNDPVKMQILRSKYKVRRALAMPQKYKMPKNEVLCKFLKKSSNGEFLFKMEGKTLEQAVRESMSFGMWLLSNPRYWPYSRYLYIGLIPFSTVVIPIILYKIFLKNKKFIKNLKNKKK